MNQTAPSFYAWPGMYALHPAASTIAKPYDPSRIILAVCNYYQVNLPMLCNGGRVRKYVLARHVAWWIIRDLVRGITLKQMGRLFGNYDHTSVIHGLQKIERELSIYPDLQHDINEINETLKRSV